MRVVFGLGHPAHFHLFKNCIRAIEAEGHEVLILINDKDILSLLLEDAGLNYTVLTRKTIGDSPVVKLRNMWHGVRLVRETIKKFRPDVLVGCINEIAIASLFTGIPVLFFAEDDFRYTWIQGMIVYPFVTRIVSPDPVNVGPFRYKKLPYHGFQKLAYLHPAWFTPDRAKVKITDEKYFIIRLVGMSAYHDVGKKGMGETLLPALLEALNHHGKVFITSEIPIIEEYQKYRLVLNPSDIHHYMYFASMFISDSQSMSVEASLLGTPNVRISDFAGRVSVLESLEKKYGLTTAFRPGETDKVLSLIREWLGDEELKTRFAERRDAMLREMTDVTVFMTGLITSYDRSKKRQ